VTEHAQNDLSRSRKGNAERKHSFRDREMEADCLIVPYEPQLSGNRWFRLNALRWTSAPI